ncbi:MAG: trehalose-phosphatase [Kiloniellales bacterium]
MNRPHPGKTATAPSATRSKSPPPLPHPTADHPTAAHPTADHPTAAWALFLDVDGTLLHFAATPDGVESGAVVQRVLAQLLDRLEGALALVSGRSLANLDSLFDPLVLPAAGLHGLERRDASGRLHRLGEAEALDHLRRRVAAAVLQYDGVIFEDKERAIAVHYRQAPDHGAAIRTTIEALVRPEARDLKVLHGKLVSEIKPRHADKGSAIRAFMEEPPYAGRTPVFLGDDTTDEDGFAAVNALGGVSIQVFDRKHPSGESAARFALDGVDQAIAWLERAAAALDRTRCESPR